jgi:hypothetical protein
MGTFATISPDALMSHWNKRDAFRQTFDLENYALLFEALSRQAGDVDKPLRASYEDFVWTLSTRSDPVETRQSAVRKDCIAK